MMAVNGINRSHRCNFSEGRCSDCNRTKEQFEVDSAEAIMAKSRLGGGSHVSEKSKMWALLVLSRREIKGFKEIVDTGKVYTRSHARVCGLETGEQLLMDLENAI